MPPRPGKGSTPPVVVPPDGEIRVLWEGRSPLLGIDTTTPKAEASVQVPPGGRLLLFSDGLVEARTRAIDAGIADLVELLGCDRNLDVEELAENLEVHDLHKDDVCILSLTRGLNPVPSETGGLV